MCDFRKVQHQNDVRYLKITDTGRLTCRGLACQPTPSPSTGVESVDGGEGKKRRHPFPDTLVDFLRAGFELIDAYTLVLTEGVGSSVWSLDGVSGSPSDLRLLGCGSESAIPCSQSVGQQEYG